MKYGKGFKYQVKEVDEVFDVPWLPTKLIVNMPFLLVQDCKVTVRVGYAWDGASGPAINTKSFIRGSLIHDVLYQLMRMEILAQEFRPSADKTLIMVCDEDGMWKVRQKWVLFTVQKFAARAAHPDNVRKVYTAP